MSKILRVFTLGLHNMFTKARLFEGENFLILSRKNFIVWEIGKGASGRIIVVENHP